MATKPKTDINMPLLVTIVVVSALFLLVTVIAVDGWYRSQEEQIVAQKWDESPNTWLENLRQQERTNLADHHRINRQHWHVTVSDAMRYIADPKAQEDNSTVKQILHGAESGT